MTNEVLQKIASDEQNISSSNGLEPKLRFKEFDGKWSRNILGNCCDIIMGQSPDSSSYNNNCIGLPLVQGNADMCERIATPQRYTSQPTKICEAGSIILSVRAPVGTVGKTFQKICLGRGVCGITSKNIEFMYQYLLNNENSWRHIEQGGTFTAINSDDIKSFPIILPSLPEQKKIADFLSLIDQRIEKQRRLVESLKKYKRGLFLKLYNDSEKKGYKICDLGKYCATGALSKDDIDASGKYPCILYGELFTKYGEVIKQVASRTNIIPTYLSGTNEILFPSSTTADAQSLIFPSSLKIKNIFLGGDLFTIKLKNEFDSDFISYLVNFKYKNTLARYAQGITIIHLHYTDIKEQVIDIPNVNTQFNISSVMRKIETIIEMNSNELNSLLLMKKGFLQKMFI